MPNADNILLWVLFTPLVGAGILLFIPSEKKDAIRWFTNIVMGISMLAAAPLVSWYDNDAGGFQFTVDAEWIPSIGASFSLGLDGISYLLVMLTVVLGFIAVLCSWSSIQERVKEYYIMFLLLQVGMLGVFMSLDLFLFYVFWEVMLVPMYFIIGIWGHERRLYAAIKFFLYTLIGSVLMLLGILGLYYFHATLHAPGESCPAIAEVAGHTVDTIKTFSIPVFLELGGVIPVVADAGNWITQGLLFWAFFFAFAIKVPMFPFHTWLPDAHVEAPTAGSVILAGVLLKMGTYGFMRFSLPMFPRASLEWAPLIMAVSAFAIIYGALVCMMQKDMKKLIAYSSVSHMGFITLGIFALNTMGLSGGLLQQINHGISTGALFLLVGFAYERRHTRLIKDYGGLSHVMRGFSIAFFVIMLASMGMPLLNGFIGEFTILLGVWQVSRVLTAISVLGVVLGAAYLLWLYQRVFLGEITNEKNKSLSDLNWREYAMVIPLVLWCFWIGIYPKPYFEVMKKPVEQIVQKLENARHLRSVEQAFRTQINEEDSEEGTTE